MGVNVDLDASAVKSPPQKKQKKPYCAFALHNMCYDSIIYKCVLHIML